MYGNNSNKDRNATHSESVALELRCGSVGSEFVSASGWAWLVEKPLFWKFPGGSRVSHCLVVMRLGMHPLINKCVGSTDVDSPKVAVNKFLPGDVQVFLD